MIIVKEKLIDFKNTRKDPVGDIYEYNGKMLRIINKPYKRYIEKLMSSQLIEQLVKKEFLVETYVSNDSYEDGRLILEHKKITPPQTASQWTFEMMKDAAELVLRINMVCWEYGYELKDCHQANILFDGTRPVWVDFGSIVKRNRKEKGWSARKEFLQRYYYPLKLWSRGYEKTIEALFKSTMNLNLEELMGIYYHMPLACSRYVTSVNSFFRKKANLEFKYLLSKLESMKYHSDTQWGNYQDSYWGRSNKRFDYEIEWINRIPDVRTMIELGANQGYFSYLAEKRTKLEKIISTDYDKKAVDIMYRRLKGKNADENKITSLLLDFVWMPLEQLKKYQCDLVVANALTHHLLLTQRMTLTAMIERLAVLAKRYVIVEFMPYGVNQSKVNLPEWYTLDNFLESLQTRFTIVDVYKAEKKRIIVIGKNNECENIEV